VIKENQYHSIIAMYIIPETRSVQTVQPRTKPVSTMVQITMQFTLHASIQFH